MMRSDEPTGMRVPRRSFQRGGASDLFIFIILVVSSKRAWFSPVSGIRAKYG